MAEVFGQLIFDALLVHADDREDLQRAHPLMGAYPGVGFIHIDGQQDGYLLIRAEDRIYRIKEVAFKQFPAPKFGIGDRVKTRNGTLRTGWIARIIWHFDRNEPMYFLEVAGAVVPCKKVARRYFQEDLEHVGE